MRGDKPRNLSHYTPIATGFDGFQIAALGCFLLLFLGRTAYLRVVHGINPIAIGAGKPPAQALLEGSFLVALPAWLYEVLAYAWPLPWRIFPAPFDRMVLESPLARGAGALLVVLGLVLFALALRSFGESWRVGIDRATPGALVTRGVFAWSRNPIFLFMDLYALGTFLLSGRLVFLAFAAAVIAALHYQIRQEERFLLSRYGDAYRAYCARTPRYLLW